MDEANDGKLLERVRAGEEEAARLFFRRHHSLVARIARSRGTERQGEEDLCQMIFARIFANIEQYGGSVPIEHWISRIAVNTCLAEWKRVRRRPERTESDLSEEAARLLRQVADTAAPEAEVAREAQEVVRQLLGRLEPVDRMIISLLHIDLCSVAETSALTGLSQAVVKIRAFRARRRLRKLIQPVAAKFL
ncbi:RNA polymerase sigma factor [soil metagenome]